MGPKKAQKKAQKKVSRGQSFLQDMKTKKRKNYQGTKKKATATRAKRKPTTKKVPSRDPPYLQKKGPKRGKKNAQVAKRGRKRKQTTRESRFKQIVKRPNPVKKSRQKKQKPLMWEAYHIPAIKKHVLDWDCKWEQNLALNRFCSSSFINQDNYNETFIEKIYHLENELSLMGEKYRNNKDWIKELYEVCQKEINETKEILNKVYELKTYFKPITNYEDKKQSPSLAAIDEELYTFGLYPPLWVGSSNETAPPGCGSIPAHPLRKKVSKKADIREGQYVAAFVILDQKIVELPDKGEIYDTARGFLQLEPESSFPSADLKSDGSWILARCIRTPEGRRKEYIIADIDDEDEMDGYEVCLPGCKILGQALPHFRMPRKALVPLPTCIADPEFNPEAIFPVGAEVLALYKETTSFFPAVVEDTPKSPSDPYHLRFQDENQNIQNQVFLVLQKYVIEYQDVDKIFTRGEIAQLRYLKIIEY